MTRGSYHPLLGGVGANEAGVAGLLIVLGVDGGAGGAAAMIQRVLMTGTAVVFGMAAYAVARRRFRLDGVFQVAAHEPRGCARLTESGG